MIQEKREKIRVVGMHCATCVNTVTKSIGRVNGVSEVSVNLATGYAEILGNFKLNEIVDSVRKSGYDVESQDIRIAVRANPENASNILAIVSSTDGVIASHFNPATGVLSLKVNPLAVSPESLIGKLEEYSASLIEKGEASEVSLMKRELTSMVYALIVASVFTIFVLYFQYTGFAFYALLSSIPVMFYAGRRYFKGAYRALRNRTADMDTLVALSSGTAWIYSVLNLLNGGAVFFDAASLLVTFVLVGKTLDSYLRFRISFIHVAKLQARLSTGETVDADQVNIGDIVIVKSGENVPVDGIVDNGDGEADESILTGEPLPVEKKKGNAVTAGSSLVNGYLEIYATRCGDRTYMSQLVQAVNDASTSTVGLKRTVDRITSYFTPLIIAIAAITFLVWHFYVPVGIALLFSIAVLASACPCALGLATPLAIMVQVRRLSKKGIIVRRGDALEKVRHIKTVILDKTGTVTVGQLKVVPKAIIDQDGFEMAVALERLSSHPVARAISSLSEAKNDVTGFTEFIGEGVLGIIDGHSVLVGKRNFIAKNCDVNIEGDIIACVDSKPVASFTVQDEIRDGMKELIEELKSYYEVMIATGDSSAFADEVGRELGIKVVKGLTAEEKAELVKSMENPMFIGDGVNDALAIKQAYVGVSMNSGSEISKQAGDVIITSPTAIKTLIDGSYILEKRIKENLAWAFGYNAILIPLAAGILYPVLYLPPQYAALAMSMNSVAVTLWSFLRP
ncbi:MAG: heavy metal translocating P-type ATPase [Nitrososphaeria archaeon]